MRLLTLPLLLRVSALAVWPVLPSAVAQETSPAAPVAVAVTPAVSAPAAAPLPDNRSDPEKAIALLERSTLEQLSAQEVFDTYAAVLALPEAPEFLKNYAYMKLRGRFNGSRPFFQKADALPPESRAAVQCALSQSYSDWDAIIAQPDAPPKWKALALLKRAFAFRKRDNRKKAAAECSAVLALPGAPAEFRAVALLARAELAGDVQALADKLAVAGMSGAPLELRLFALEGMTREYGLNADFADLFPRYSAVVDFVFANGTKKEQVEILLKRADFFEKNRRFAQAVADYSAVLAFADTPESSRWLDAFLPKSRLLARMDATRIGERKIAAVLADTQTAPEAKAAALVAQALEHEKAERLLEEYACHAALLALPGVPAEKKILPFLAGEPKKNEPYLKKEEREKPSDFELLNVILARRDVSLPERTAALALRAKVFVKRNDLGAAVADYRALSLQADLPPVLRRQARLCLRRFDKLFEETYPYVREKSNLPPRLDEKLLNRVLPYELLYANGTPPEKRVEALLFVGLLTKQNLLRPIYSPLTVDPYLKQSQSGGSYFRNMRNEIAAYFDAAAHHPGAPESLKTEALRQLALLAEEDTRWENEAEELLEAQKLELTALLEYYPGFAKPALESAPAPTSVPTDRKPPVPSVPDLSTPEQSPRHKAIALRQRALAFRDSGNPSKAIADFTTLIDDPAVPVPFKYNARFDRAALYQKFGQPERALAEYDNMLQRAATAGADTSMIQSSRVQLKNRMRSATENAVKYGSLPSFFDTLTRWEDSIATFTSASATPAGIDGITVPGFTWMPEEKAGVLLRRIAQLERDGDKAGALEQCISLLTTPGLSFRVREWTFKCTAELFKTKMPGVQNKNGKEGKTVEVPPPAIPETSAERKAIALCARAYSSLSDMTPRCPEDTEAVLAMPDTPPKWHALAWFLKGKHRGGYAVNDAYTKAIQSNALPPELLVRAYSSRAPYFREAPEQHLSDILSALAIPEISPYWRNHFLQKRINVNTEKKNYRQIVADLSTQIEFFEGEWKTALLFSRAEKYELLGEPDEAFADAFTALNSIKTKGHWERGEWLSYFEGESGRWKVGYHDNIKTFLRFSKKHSARLAQQKITAVALTDARRTPEEKARVILKQAREDERVKDYSGAIRNYAKLLLLPEISDELRIVGFVQHRNTGVDHRAVEEIVDTILSRPGLSPEEQLVARALRATALLLQERNAETEMETLLRREKAGEEFLAIAASPVAPPAVIQQARLLAWRCLGKTTLQHDIRKARNTGAFYTDTSRKKYAVISKESITSALESLKTSKTEKAEALLQRGIGLYENRFHLRNRSFSGINSEQLLAKADFSFLCASPDAPESVKKEAFRYLAEIRKKETRADLGLEDLLHIRDIEEAAAELKYPLETEEDAATRRFTNRSMDSGDFRNVTTEKIQKINSLINNPEISMEEKRILLDKRFEFRCSLGDAKGAESDLSALLAIAEGDAEETASVLSKRADFYIATGEFIHAIADYETLLTLPVREERKMEAEAELFILWEHFGENEKALNYLEKILNNPACERREKIFALSFQIKLFENAGELDKAIAIQTALMDAGYRQDYPIERATLYLKNKNFRAAIADCETILKHNGNSSPLERIIIRASILKARAYEGLGEKEKALAEYDLLLEEKESTRYYSDRVPAFWYRGRLHGKSGNRQQEIADIDNLFRVSNRYSFDLKNFLREDDNYHDTADAAQKAIQDYSAIPIPPEKKTKTKREKTNDTRSTLYYLRGLAWKKLGETEKANFDFREALKQDNLPASLKNELNFLLQ